MVEKKEAKKERISRSVSFSGNEMSFVRRALDTYLTEDGFLKELKESLLNKIDRVGKQGLPL